MKKILSNIIVVSFLLFLCLSNTALGQFQVNATLGQIQIGNARVIVKLVNWEMFGAVVEKVGRREYYRFPQNVILSNTTIESATSLIGSRFDSTFIIGEVNFNSKVDFSSVLFSSNALFLRTTFNSEAYFDSVKFKKDCFMMFSEFNSHASFSTAQFDSVSSFLESKFDSKADFSGANFNFEADFRKVHFNSLVNFSAAKFNRGMKVDDMVLPDYMDFRYVNGIGKSIDLTVCMLDSLKRVNKKNYRCKIALFGSDIDKISINMELFELWFPSETYEQKISTYERVLKKFEKDGFKESYKILDVEYRKIKLNNEGLYLFAISQEWWWNFGYNPEWVFLWSVLFLATFFVIIIFFFQKFYSVYDIEFLHLERLRGKKIVSFQYKGKSYGYFTRPTFSYVVRLFIHAFIYTAVVFFGVKLDIDKFNKNSQMKKMYYYAVLFILLFCYLLGLFCSAFILRYIVK